MREYRPTPIEVGAEGEPLQTFSPETGNPAVIATHQSAPAESVTLLRRPRTVSSRTAGWLEGLLLFLSGAAMGVLSAIVLSLEWPANADTGANVQPFVETQQSRTPPVSTPGSMPTPVATSGPPAINGSASEANLVARSGRTVGGLSTSSGYRGSLSVNSQPRGASIFINERYVGRTPMVIRALPVGSRAVRVRLDGYAPWSRGVNIVANEFTTVAAKLNPAKTAN